MPGSLRASSALLLMWLFVGSPALMAQRLTDTSNQTLTFTIPLAC